MTENEDIILDMLRKNNKMSCKEIVEQTTLTEGDVKYGIRRLQEKDKIDKIRTLGGGKYDARNRLYFIKRQSYGNSN